MVMRPIPPSWMRKIITIWPKKLNSLPVSHTARPVTQEAEVAVNKASIGCAHCPLAWEIGRVKSKAPNSIKKTKERPISVLRLILAILRISLR